MRAMTVDPLLNERRAFHEFELEGWRRAASHYANAFARVTVQAAPHVLDAGRVGAGIRMLDLASGPGDLSGLAAQRGAQVTALDFSPEMVAIAKSRYPGVDYRIGDAQELPFGDASFDVVTMSFLLGHLSSPERAFGEALRVLVRGGRIAVSWWTPGDQSVGFGIITGAVAAHGNTDVGLPGVLPFDHFREPNTIGLALQTAGFVEPESRLAPLVWNAASGEEVLDSFRNGSVRTAGLLRRQTPEALEAIQKTVLESCRAYERNGRLELPMPAWIVTARKP
jgi:SAM-dependent methyltransferase